MGGKVTIVTAFSLNVHNTYPNCSMLSQIVTTGASVSLTLITGHSFHHDVEVSDTNVELSSSTLALCSTMGLTRLRSPVFGDATIGIDRGVLYPHSNLTGQLGGIRGDDHCCLHMAWLMIGIVRVLPAHPQGLIKYRRGKPFYKVFAL